MRQLLSFLLTGMVASLSIAACNNGARTTSGAGGSLTSATSTTSLTRCGAATCKADEICSVPAGACGAAPTCQPATSCLDEAVVCGCDGKNYKNACEAAYGGGGTANVGACAPPANHFTCIYEHQVPTYCTLGAEYCRLTATGDLYKTECVALPSGCGPKLSDCSCLSDTCSSNYCGVDKSNGSATVLCPAPV